MKTLLNHLRTGIAVAAVAFAAQANANIIFILGNNPQPDEENILFNGPGTNPGPALTVTGATNQSGLFVFFTGTEDLITPASGQARIEAVDGQFTTLTFGVVGGTFHDFILNPRIFNIAGGPPATGTITVTVDQVLGSDAVFSYGASSAGNNFLTVLALDGQRIQNITIDSDAPLSFLDLQQPRISGGFLCPPGSTDPRCTGLLIVPEPSVLALLGLGLLAFAFPGLRRRRKN